MQRELRIGAPVEVRSDQAGLRVEGYAAVFDEETVIGGSFREVIAKGAFANAIRRGDDVVFLVNHDGLPLARTRSNTLSLAEDDHGLRISTLLDPEDPDVKAIAGKMRRGDLDKMSFAFIPDRQEWDDTGDMPLRVIRDLRLYDVSVVTMPAYEGTEIGLRHLDQFRREQRRKNRSSAAIRLRMKANLAGFSRENGS